MQWQFVAIASTMMAVVYTALESRVSTLPRDGWALTLVLALLLVGGLRPNLFVKSPSAVAEKIVSL